MYPLDIGVLHHETFMQHSGGGGVGRSNAAPAARINKTELRANAGGRHVYQLASAAFS